MVDESELLSSNQLIELTGITRTSLNNFIALGILPKPTFPQRDKANQPRMGYYPTSTVNTIKHVLDLEAQGKSLADIIQFLSRERNLAIAGFIDTGQGLDDTLQEPPYTPPPSDDRRKSYPVKIDGSLRLTLDNFEFPAYLINPRCELEWANDAAMDRFIGQNRSLPSEISDRNLFNLLLRDSPIADIVDMPGLIRYHMSIAKNRLTKPSLLSLSQSINPSHMDMLVRIFDEVEPAAVKPVLNSYVNLAKPGEGDRWHVVYTTAFREGYLFTYLPESQDNSSLLQLLGRRDIVIRDLLKKRGPYLTPLAVIVADLKDSLDICASLPPDEYFELVNSIWSSMTPLLRKYYSTQGKHRADGMVYYCFPQPDSNYILNAIRCATEMKSVMREISNKWRKKKNWMNELELNIGIDEGHEWFGTYQTPSHLELTALGDTLTIASRLSDFARSGTIWITKNGLGKLSLPDRETVHYGIRRSSTDGFEALVPSTYSRISNLVDLNDPKNMSYQDIAVLPVTEILDVEIDSDD